MKIALYSFVVKKRRLEAVLFRTFIKGCFKRFGKNVQVHTSFHFEYPEKIVISDNVQIGRNVTINGRSDKAIGVFIGEGVHIKDNVTIDAYGGYVKLGKHVRIGHCSFLAGHGGLEFGEYSGVSGLSYLISANHIFSDPDKPFIEQGESKIGIKIGRNVWGGAGVIITDGVTVGDNVVIGAGSVVRKSIPDNAVVLGNPANIAYYH